MKDQGQAILDLIEADYKSDQTYWIERRLNKPFEHWFRQKNNVVIDDLLAERQISEL